MVKGIGPHFAKKLVRAFGEQVFDVIEQTPEKALRVFLGWRPDDTFRTGYLRKWTMLNKQEPDQYLITLSGEA